MIREHGLSHYLGDPLHYKDRVFRCPGPGLTAIDLGWAQSPSVARCSAIIENCHFEPGVEGWEWENCIKLFNGWNVVIKNCTGFSWSTGGNFQTGIVLDGQSNDVKIDIARFTHCVTGVDVRGESEGPKLNFVEVLGAHHGVVMITKQGEAGGHIVNSHFSVKRAGIIAEYRPQAFYSNLLIYRYEPDNPYDRFDGILLGQDCHDTSIRDVKVRLFGAKGKAVNSWANSQNLKLRDVEEI